MVCVKGYISLSKWNHPQAMIAERLLADRPTVTGIIQRLLQKEWILIKHNPKDKRSHLIFLTDETKTLIQEIENVSDEVIKMLQLVFLKRK